MDGIGKKILSTSFYATEKERTKKPLRFSVKGIILD